MKIVMASSEMAPMAATGRLGETVALLADALVAAGHEVSVVLPYHRTIREHCKARNSGFQLTLPVGDQRLQAVVYEAETTGGVQLFLISREDYFDRDALYGSDDDAARYIFFSRAVAELARHLAPAPDVLHLHDWQTALAAVLLKEAGLPFRSVLSLYDLANQGNFPASDFALTQLPGHYFTSEALEFHGRLNLLKGGILSADALVTASARYAAAIQTPAHGHGLEGALRSRSALLHGIPPGLDRTQWNPADDTRLVATYSADDLSGKRTCRDHLLRELGLKPHPPGPTIAFFHSPAISGQTLDLLTPILDRLLIEDLRVILVGEHAPRHERDLLVAARQFPGKFAYRGGLSDTLRHEITAGADLLLLSSHPDPAGETSQIALAYGTLPVVRAAEGLHPVVTDFDPAGFGNGFVYHRDEPEALHDALLRALGLYRETSRWQVVVHRAMSAPSTWADTARRLARVYGDVK